MQKLSKSCLITLLLSNITMPTFAAPWFTGPILAPAGVTIPLGHINIEPYVFYTQNMGRYDRHWRLSHAHGPQSTQFNPIVTYGLADKVDVQYSLPYTINKNYEITKQDIGDLSTTLGFQVLKQQPNRWLPNLRVTLQEIFPTGRYDNLNPTDKGTGATGSGSYQSVVSLNFQYLTTFTEPHYLRSRFSVAYVYAAPVALHGSNTYGGSALTAGTINPGETITLDLAGEYTITKHWVAVMEGYYFHRNKSHFNGISDVDNHGKFINLGHDIINEFSLAPAIEYNFSANYGIIAGVWFAVRGQDAPDFVSSIIAFNAFF